MKTQPQILSACCKVKIIGIYEKNMTPFCYSCGMKNPKIAIILSQEELDTAIKAAVEKQIRYDSNLIKPPENEMQELRKIKDIVKFSHLTGIHDGLNLASNKLLLQLSTNQPSNA